MMPRLTKVIIEGLSDFNKQEIIWEFEQFEKDGCIGECQLRTLTESLPGGQAMAAMNMSFLAFEAYRYFGNKYLIEQDANVNLNWRYR
jgi:hypothetical protein